MQNFIKWTYESGLRNQYVCKLRTQKTDDVGQIEFVADGNETSVISKRLQQKRIKPTLDNMKRY